MSPTTVPASLGTVLRAVRTAGEPVSRAEVAVATGLTKATVSAQVERLLAAGVVQESAPRPRAGAGRPAAGLAVSGDRWAALGVQIGVDFLVGAVRDLAGDVRHRVVRRSSSRAADDVLPAVASVVTELRAAAARQSLTAVGLGVAVPGLVSDGVVRLAPNLGWTDVDVAGPLGADLVDNEATLAVLAECGAPSEVRSGAGVLVVTGEVGIGAGAVLSGEVLRGSRGWAGELGHVCVEPEGTLCGCGARGCLETVAGQHALLDAAGLDLAPGTTLGGDSPIEAVVAAIERPPVRMALRRAATGLGRAVAGAVNVLDVDEVVLGGTYADLAPYLLPGVRAEVVARVLRHRISPVTVRASELGPDAPVLGAAGAVLAAALDDPEALLG